MKKYKYIIRNDLALAKDNLKLIKTTKYDTIKVLYFKEDKHNYSNIIFNNIETKNKKEELINIIVKELKKYLKKYNLNKDKTCLVVGLGNENIISDSLGSKSLTYITATAYIDIFNISNNYRKVYTYKPNVLKETGFMAFKGIKALKKELKPDFIIIIDSLVSDNIKYLNKLVQITDRGITPGSGIANYQNELNEKTLGVPVITIGIPLAIEASSIIRDIIAPKEKEVEYTSGYDFLVCTKDIDIKVNNLSKILGLAINRTLNNINND
ncbi:MAG: GPR endopeptidase [Ruminococcus sp.]|nr:GPR endopeptidase [Ruminococcus sp.]